MATLFVEIVVLFLLLRLFTILDYGFLGVYVSPIFSALAAGYFYWKVGEMKDAGAVNNNLPHTTEDSRNAGL
ncbi:MAG: hypothetical protein OER96_02710 [Gammaproteobacteria bacterium]|nr:hypothetical protein [Gammaproteobacteria bacterium]